MAEGLQLYETETPTQVFSCEYCEVFKYSFFFTEQLWQLLLQRFLNVFRNVDVKCEFLNAELNLRKLFVNIFDALHDLVPFVPFKKREKHPWRSVTYNKILG